MTRKILITGSLIIFVLSACGSNVETIQPTSTSVPTLPATSTFTAEPTATHTPIPTATPFRYTSCADPELIAEVVTDFESRNGMTLDQAYELTRKDPDFGQETTRFFGEPSYLIGTKIFYIGNRLVSGGGIPGEEVKNVLCSYGRIMAPNEDGTYSTVPIVIGWEDMQGNFHKFVFGHDRASIAAEGDKSRNIEYKLYKLDSLSDSQEFLKIIPDGAILDVQIRTFSNFSKVDDIVEIDGESLTKTSNLKDFLLMFGQQWAVRNFDKDRIGIPSTLSAVDSSVGDQGLYSSIFIYWDEGNLQPSQ